MFRSRALLYFVLLLVIVSSPVSADEKKKDGKAAADRPIQALLVTGGCCHDYDRQKLILTRGISARANVRWTVVHQGGTTTDTPIPLYNDPDWADGFDIVIHNECFSDVKDLEFVDRILQPHKDGTPAILIHCAMHCYRVKDDRWFKFVGLQSPGHGPHYSYTAENVKPDHPIMDGFGPMFVAPKGELYHSVKVFDTATPLAQANRQSDGMPQVCVWTNDYQGTKVFGCTMGHYNETMTEPKYLDMMTKGLLWAVGRDIKTHFTPTTEDQDEAIKALAATEIRKTTSSNVLPGNCCGDANLAFGKPVTSRSEQDGNFRRHLTDGKLDTRWCASGSQVNEWVTVDLEEPQDVAAIRLHWEKRTGIAYRYTVEASADNRNWNVVVDASANKKKGGLRTHKIDAKGVRYLKTTFLGAERNLWGSLWELEVSAGELPDISTVAPSDGPSVIASDVKTPEGFVTTLFGSPPDVNYPVCLTAAATGEVFVGVDEQGSLGKEPGRGKVLRCIDTDGDGVADQINTFARMDHPRGLVYDNGSLWVLHPPFLSVFRDTDGDGISNESEVLIEGISTDEVNRRGADHTTNGIRMGIDGWIYIAVGDFGFVKAVGKDGRTLSRRGGGIVRVQPDGTEMEIYSWGQRNILDVSIDPYMNIFTRDNTNDGGGWDIRVSHILQTANYGYPSLYKNFSSEIMPPLADYGGGSGCGSMYFHDERWPEKFRDLLLTCDWGTSQVYSHDLPQNGATYDPQQDTFLKLPRPTDIDVDASGRMFVSSWKNGRFAYDGPNVGFVAMVIPSGFVPKPVRPSHVLSNRELLDLLTGPSATGRFHAQRELLRRGDAQDALLKTAADEETPLYGAVAAIYTLKQMDGARALSSLQDLTKHDHLREHCLRAMADRTSELEGISLTPFLDGLADQNPRVQATALIGLNRILSHGTRQGLIVADGQKEQSAQDIRDSIARAILPLTVRTDEEPKVKGDAWRQPDPGRVIPHLAIKTLVAIQGGKACVEGLNGPYRAGALAALRELHLSSTIDALFRILSTSADAELRMQVWTTLIRLYHKEGEYKGGWWGTRPDTTGPYYDRKPWKESERIAAAVKVALTEGDKQLAEHIQAELKRHVVKLDGISEADIAATAEPEEAISLPKADPRNPNQIANIEYKDVLTRTMKIEGSADRGMKLFRGQSCVNCHTFANGQKPKGPHLVDIGKRYRKDELIESVVTPSKKIAQGFDTWSFVMDSGRQHTGFVVLESAESVVIRETNGLSRELLQDDIDDRVKQEISMMPKGVVGNLTCEQLADLIAYLQSLH